MGILTNLVEMKTRQDDSLLKGAIGGFQTILTNPDVTPEAKEYYQKALLDLVDGHFDSTNAQGGKGGGKKGAVGKLFGGLLTGLTGGLNQTLSKENERGKQIRGSLGQTAGSPDKPKRMFLTNEEKQQVKIKQQEAEDNENIRMQEELVKRKDKQALTHNQEIYDVEFKRLTGAGFDPKEAAREANALASGRSPGSAGAAASMGPVKVVWGTVKGQEDQGQQMLMVSTRNPGGFKDADGNEYTKAEITGLGNAPPPPQRMFGRTLEISKYIESKGYQPGTPEYNRWFGIIAGADLRTSLGRTQQQAAIAGYESGIGLGQGFPEIPSNPKAVAEASGKDTGAAATGAQGAQGATAEPPAKPKLTPKSATPTSAAAATPKSAASATATAAPKAPALGSQDDRFISMYLGNLFGDASSAGGNAKVGITKGREALKKVTGLSAVDFSMLESANKETKKAMADTIQRAVATARINDVLNEFGDELVVRAKDALNTGSPILTKPIREIELSAVGDPKLRRFLLAFNAFQRQYTTLTSGGPLSKAMPHVATAELTDKIMNPNMTLKEVIAAVDQAKIEGKREQTGFQESAKSTIDQITGSLKPKGEGGGSIGGEDKEYNGHKYHRDKAGEPWKLVK